MVSHKFLLFDFANFGLVIQFGTFGGDDPLTYNIECETCDTDQSFLAVDHQSAGHRHSNRQIERVR